MNVSKTKCMLFGTGLSALDKENFKCMVIDNCLEIVENAKYLGLYLYDQLSWQAHINYICKKVYGSFIINRTKKQLSKANRHKLYYSLIFPYLYYGCEIWGFSYAKYIKRLEIYQKRIIRIINNKPYRAHTLSIFQSSRILPFKNLVNLKCCLLMHDINCNVAPRTIQNLFPKKSTMHVRNLRGNNDFYIKTHRTKIRSDTIFIKGPSLWNNSTDDLKRIKSKSTFKASLKKIYLLVH